MEEMVIKKTKVAFVFDLFRFICFSNFQLGILPFLVLIYACLVVCSAMVYMQLSFQRKSSHFDRLGR